VNTEKTLASQALARGGAPAAKSLKTYAFLVVDYFRESLYTEDKEAKENR